MTPPPTWVILVFATCVIRAREHTSAELKTSKQKSAHEVHTTRLSTEQTNGVNRPVYATSAKLGEREHMPKIVPGTERTVPAGKDEPRAPRSKADPQITALMTAFAAQYFQSNELDWRTRTAVKLLIKWYGTVGNIMLAATRAKEMEAQLCRKGQKFTISTVYYYAKYFD
jgi:hypothetical protein